MAITLAEILDEIARKQGADQIFATHGRLLPDLMIKEHAFFYMAQAQTASRSSSDAAPIKGNTSSKKRSKLFGQP